MYNDCSKYIVNELFDSSKNQSNYQLPQLQSTNQQNKFITPINNPHKKFLINFQSSKSSSSIQSYTDSLIHLSSNQCLQQQHKQEQDEQQINKIGCQKSAEGLAQQHFQSKSQFGDSQQNKSCHQEQGQQQGKSKNSNAVLSLAPSYIIKFGDQQISSDQSVKIIENDKVPKKYILAQTEELQQADCYTVTHQYPYYKLYKRHPKDYWKIPIPPNHVLQLMIKRELLDSKWRYNVIQSKLKKKIMTIIKKGNVWVYKLCNEANMIIGKLQANFFGTQFNCLDDSNNNCITIQYKPNFFGLNGPRMMKVYIPSQQATPSNRPLNIAQDLNICKFINKTPKWSSQIKAFVLNFQGRATYSSVKNFIIINPQNDNNNSIDYNEQHVKALFGKVGKDHFNLDVKHPFNLTQAVSLAISSLDRKFACQ